MTREICSATSRMTREMRRETEEICDNLSISKIMYLSIKND
jgi:hypothetical protein